MTAQWPPEVAAYLRELNRRLAGLPDPDRYSIVSDVTEHIRSGLADGLTPHQIVTNLGPAAEVAASAFESQAHPGWWTPTRLAQLVAAALFVAAGLLIAFIPLGTSVSEQSSSNDTVSTTVETARLADDIGWYRVAIMAVIPLVLAVGPMLMRRRAHKIATIAAATLASLLCILALLSVGILFLPGVIGLVVAAALLGRPAKRVGNPASKRSSRAEIE